MCGITGFFSDKVNNDLNIIYSMTESLSHRGPDNLGVWSDETNGIYLGHTRLTILDKTKSGDQPMISHSGRYVISFNGEIYNHLFLRKEIEKRKFVKWNGTSDTETLLISIDTWGIKETLKKIEGMFSLGLWDKYEKKLILARDRFGEKPLYYGFQKKQNNSVFLFGSELKAIKKHPFFSKKISKDALARYLNKSVVSGTDSIYENLYKVVPGSFLVFSTKNQEINIEKYWDANKVLLSPEKENISFFEAKNQLSHLLKKTIRNQMVADVPLGAFLSGGIDSSLVVSYMQEISASPVKTFTIGFEDKIYDESKYARQVSDYLGTDHSEIIISPNELIDEIQNIPYIFDEPFADSSQIPTIALSRFASNSVKVALSGDGGDEVFGGYSRYVLSKKYWRIINRFPYFKNLIFNTINKKDISYLNSFRPFLGDKFMKLIPLLNADSLETFYEKFNQTWEINNELLKKQANTNEYPKYEKNFFSYETMMFKDLISYLPDDILTKVDRSSMSESLECRAPLLNHNFVELAFKMPMDFKIKRKGKSFVQKYILKELLYEKIPKKLFERRKSGFSIPLREWLRGPLKDWAGDYLDINKIKNQGFLDAEIISKTWEEHLSGKRNWESKLWTIIMFQVWFENN